MNIKKKKNTIILMLCLTLVIMATAFSIMMSQLEIDGISRINNNNFNIYIDSVLPTEYKTAKNKNAIIGSDGISASFEAEFKKPKDYVNYEMTIKNDGTLDAQLVEAYFASNDQGEYISFINDAKVGTILKAGESMKINVIIQFNDVDSYDQNKTIVATSILNLIYVQYTGSSTTIDTSRQLIVSGDISEDENSSVVWNYYDDGTLELTGTGKTRDFTYEMSNVDDYEKLPLLHQMVIGTLKKYNYNKLPDDIFVRKNDKYIVSTSYEAYRGVFWSNKNIKKHSKDHFGIEAVNYDDFLQKYFNSDKTTKEVLTEIKRNKIYFIPITNIIIGEGITYLGKNIFANLGYEGDLILPSSIVTVADKAFQYNAITSLTLNEGLKNIGEYAFRVNSLVSVVLPTTIKVIKDKAFAQNNITSVVIQGTFNSLGSGTFFCNPLKKSNITYKNTNAKSFQLNLKTCD